MATCNRCVRFRIQYEIKCLNNTAPVHLIDPYTPHHSVKSNKKTQAIPSKKLWPWSFIICLTHSLECTKCISSGTIYNFPYLYLKRTSREYVTTTLMSLVNSVLKSLLSAFTHAQNAPKELRRRNQANFIREHGYFCGITKLVRLNVAPSRLHVFFQRSQ